MAGLKGLKLVLWFSFLVILPFVAFGVLVFELYQIHKTDELLDRQSRSGLLGRVAQTQDLGGRRHYGGLKRFYPSAERLKISPSARPHGTVTIQKAPLPSPVNQVFQGLGLDFDHQVAQSSLNESVAQLGPLPNLMSVKQPPAPPEIRLPSQNRVIFERRLVEQKPGDQ
jgi:hypothetical protein